MLRVWSMIIVVPCFGLRAERETYRAYVRGLRVVSRCQGRALLQLL
ncbi:Uncharacterised protein [Chlamydia trachomatis]|nr:Uncharacterised protein [Chlamydia trachomatis]